MLIIPAIDLQSGRAVRLLRGDFTRETVYGTDPVEVARDWIEQGAELIHVVDLDGARAGRPAQLDLVRRIAAAAPASRLQTLASRIQTPVQFGGGLRTPEDVAAAVDAGAQRVVLGTAALDPHLVRSLVRIYGDRLVVALDTRDGRVSVQGWTEASEWTMLDLAQVLLEAGVQRFLHTDVERDGALTSPNYASLESLIALGVPVIASGGVSTLNQLERLRSMGAEATIVGRALYERRFSLAEAVSHAR